MPTIKKNFEIEIVDGIVSKSHLGSIRQGEQFTNQILAVIKDKDENEYLPSGNYSCYLHVKRADGYRHVCSMCYSASAQKWYVPLKSIHTKVPGPIECTIEVRILVTDSEDQDTITMVDSVDGEDALDNSVFAMMSKPFTINVEKNAFTTNDTAIDPDYLSALEADVNAQLNDKLDDIDTILAVDELPTGSELTDERSQGQMYFCNGLIYKLVNNALVIQDLKYDSSNTFKAKIDDNASEITKIKNGTTIAKKAEQDKLGNQIDTTYQKKSDMSSYVTNQYLTNNYLTGAWCQTYFCDCFQLAEKSSIADDETITGAKTFTKIASFQAGVEFKGQIKVTEPNEGVSHIGDADTPVNTIYVCYLSNDDLDTDLSVSDLATKTWVKGKNYITNSANAFDFNNLTNKPTIPTKTSDLTNDSGFLTSHQSLSGYATQSWVNQQQFITNVANAFSYANLSGKPTLFSGSYTDLTNKPTIPTVYNPTITIQANGTTVDSFSLNQSGNKTINIPVAQSSGGVDLTSDQTISGNKTFTGVTKLGYFDVTYDLQQDPLIKFVYYDNTLDFVYSDMSCFVFYNIYSIQDVNGIFHDVDKLVSNTDYATSSTAGVVKVGAGINVNSEGVISTGASALFEDLSASIDLENSPVTLTSVQAQTLWNYYNAGETLGIIVSQGTLKARIYFYEQRDYGEDGIVLFGGFAYGDGPNLHNEVRLKVINNNGVFSGDVVYYEM